VKQESLPTAARLALAMYENEPCRICGKPIVDAAEAVFVGYSKDNKARAAHHDCAMAITETVERQRKALELVPPLLKQIRGFANDAFGGPSSLTDCIDLVLDEVENALEIGV
jgi:hypothetical protein